MPQPLDAHTLVYGFAAADEPQVSPDGARLLYTLAKSDEKTKKTTSNVWMATSDGRKEDGQARQLTMSGERKGGARWSPTASRSPLSPTGLAARRRAREPRPYSQWRQVR